MARLGKRYAFVLTPFPEGRRSREPEQSGGVLDVDSSGLERLLGMRHFLRHKRADNCEDVSFTTCFRCDGVPNFCVEHCLKSDRTFLNGLNNVAFTYGFA